jgi:signal transduction histidine kinase
MRVLLAMTALIVFRATDAEFPGAMLAVGGYVTFAIAFAAWVWTIKALPRWWSLAAHLFDCLAAAFLVIQVGHVASPVFASFYLFVVASGTLRWQWHGTILTGAAALAVVLLGTRDGAALLASPSQNVANFLMAASGMAFVALMLGCVGAYQRQLSREMLLLAAWPNKDLNDEQFIVAEILGRAVALFEVPAAVLVWTQNGLPGYNLGNVDGASGRMELDHVADEIDLRGDVPDFLSDRVMVVARAHLALVDGQLHERPGLPLDGALRARLGARTLLSCFLDGQHWQGRLVVLDRPAPTIDDLVVAKLLARLGCSSLDQYFLIEELRQAAADEERLRLARDLHDGILQTLTALGLQLHSVERLVEHDAAAAQARLAELQNHVSEEHTAFRRFITELQPGSRTVVGEPADLMLRLRTLVERIRRQWDLNVAFAGTPEALPVPSRFAQQAYWLVHEALANVARHAAATRVAVDVAGIDGYLDIVVADNGRGFSFRGRYDAGDLAVMRAGPRSLRERIVALAGALAVDSREDGVTLRIRLPLPPGAAAS